VIVNAAATADAPRQEYRTGFYGWYVIVVLTLCQTLSFLDAKLPFILVEALKADLKLSDTQIGLITGPAFSLTYAICAIPIAKISDRYSRKRVINVAILAWSGLTAAGGAALGFASFALSRVGVAAGEAGLAPAAHSIIAGYTTPASRPKAMAIFGLGAAIGTALALGLGGWIADTYGWRSALFLVGASGVALVLLVALTVKEPVRRADSTDSRILPKGNLKSLLGNGGIRNIVIGGALMGLSSGALNGWGPAYIMRSFDMSATDTGASFGGLMGALGIVGMLVGGFAASWLSKRHPGNAFRMLAAVFALASLFQFASFIVNDYYFFLGLTAASTLFVAFYFAPTYATVQSLAHPSARSFAAAVTLFAVNGLGIASGSFLAGLFSDLLRPAFDADSLRWSLILLTFAKPWAAVHYYFAARAMDKLEAT
jgi:predicted MFS family arabinose efflux permease